MYGFHWLRFKLILSQIIAIFAATPARKVSEKVHCFYTFGEKKDPKDLLGGPFCSALVLFRPTVQVCFSLLTILVIMCLLVPVEIVTSNRAIPLRNVCTRNGNGLGDRLSSQVAVPIGSRIWM